MFSWSRRFFAEGKRTSYFYCPAFRQEYVDELVRELGESGKPYELCFGPVPSRVRENSNIRIKKVLDRLKEDLDTFGDANKMITVQRSNLELLVKGCEKNSGNDKEEFD